ncbi:hypothetical protein ACWGOQ_0007690 [Aquimarina sp. M1]
MRTLFLIITSLIMGLFTVKAQTTTNTSTSSSTKVSVSIDGDTEKESYYRSFVTLDMDNDYKIKVRFMKDMKSDVKLYLIDQFGKENMAAKDGTYAWYKKIDEEEIYEVRLKGTKLKIHLNKGLASDALLKRFKAIGKELKSITSNSEKS